MVKRRQVDLLCLRSQRGLADLEDSVGRGNSRAVDQQGWVEPYESAGGKFIYYAKGWPDFAVWKVPVTGGEESKVLDGVEDGYWDLLEDGICFRDMRAKRGPPGLRAIKFFRFASGRIEDVTEIPEGMRFGGRFLSLS